MWNIVASPARFADEKLASLSIECPANLRTADELGLFVALWCGRIRDHFMIDNQSSNFSFGFVAGEIVVDVVGGRIQNQGRLQIEAGRFKITQNEKDEAQKGGSFGAQFGLGIGKLFGYGKAGVELEGKLKKTFSKTDQKDGEYYRVFWRVADAGHNFWRVFGVGLNEDNILENKIIGDQPLCHISNEGKNKIEVTVSYRCDLTNMWFKREDTPKSIKDMRFAQEKDERNRAAIATLIIGKALNRNALENINTNDKAVILAQQLLAAEMVDERA